MRRRILWENRGQFGVYRDDLPDEYAPANHPMLLLFGNRRVGVVRIDLDPARQQAQMRRMAITETEQRRGHGRRLVDLIERFAAEHACFRILVSSAPDAVGFYEKCGFTRFAPGSLNLAKNLDKEGETSRG